MTTNADFYSINYNASPTLQMTQSGLRSTSSSPSIEISPYEDSPKPMKTNGNIFGMSRGWFLFFVLVTSTLVAGVIFIAIYWPEWSTPAETHFVDDEDFRGWKPLSEETKDLIRTFPIGAYMNNNTSPCVNYYDYACGNFKEPQELVFGSLGREIAELTKAAVVRSLPDKSSPISLFFSQCVHALSGQQREVSDGAVFMFLREIMEKAPAVAVRKLHERGIMPLVVFSMDDGYVRWVKSPWTNGIPRLTAAACGYLAQNSFADDAETCVAGVTALYSQIDQILGSGSGEFQMMSNEQMANQFPLFYTSPYPGAHRVWSPIQMMSLQSLQANRFFNMWMRVLVVLDAAQYVPSIWSGVEQHIAYMPMQRMVSRPNANRQSMIRNFHSFRHGFGPFGLNASRSVINEYAQSNVLNSCQFLIKEMLPHLIEQATVSQEEREEAAAYFAQMADFLRTSTIKSKRVLEDIKPFLTQLASSLHFQVGFPGTTPRISWNSNSFLQMVWDIRTSHMEDQTFLRWPGSLHADSCDAEVMVAERQIFVPMCLYRRSWFRDLLPNVMYHELSHLLDPRALEAEDAPRKPVAIMKNIVSCMNNPPLERFADIMGLRLAYEFCIASGKCSDRVQIRRFLIQSAQMWCQNNRVVYNDDAAHGSNRDRMMNAFYFFINLENVPPLSLSYQCSPQSLLFGSVCPYF